MSFCDPVMAADAAGKELYLNSPCNKAKIMKESWYGI